MTLLLEPDKIYYINSRTNAKDNLFNSEDDYFYFLKNYAELLVPIVETYAYCLLPNQLHCLIKIKSEKEIFDFLKVNNRIPEENLSFQEYKNLSTNTANLVGNIFSLQLSKQFSNFFTTCTPALNKQPANKRSLIIQNSKSIEINSDEQIKDTIINIHCNSAHSGNNQNFELWKFSSYSAYLSDKPSAIKRSVALDIFESKDNFINCHRERAEKVASEKLEQIIE